MKIFKIMIQKKAFGFLGKRWKILFPAVLTALVAIWFQSPNYVPCSSFSEFGSYEQNGECIIPDNLIVEGNILGLPKTLHVKGNLEIRGTQISNLPSKFRVDGDVYLYKTSIGSIPEDSYIGGSFQYDLGFGSPTIYCDDISPKAVIKGNSACEPQY